MATYVMSDIHGQKNLFDKMLKKINFTDSDDLYILGDVIDRGPDGINLLLEIINTPNIHMLLGNHEYMMGQCLSASTNANKIRNIWECNGGSITIKQLKKCSTEDFKNIIYFINNLPVEIDVTVNNKEFVLCHAQPHPTSFKNDPFENFLIHYQYNTDEEFSVWHRYKDTEYGSVNKEEIGIIPDENFNTKTIIFGHTPVCYYPDIDTKKENNILFDKNTINIDCGCAAIMYNNNNYRGRLACLRLDDMQEYYVNP